MMIRVIAFFLVIMCGCSKPSKVSTEVPSASLKTAFDPTGTYSLVSEVRESSGERFGYSGEVRVIRLSDSRIAIGFSIDIGAPSYNSGGFVDTLEFRGNVAVYRDLELDSTGSVTFTFYREGVTSKEETRDFNAGCGFGHGVVADGYFRKVSSERPSQLDPMENDR